MATRAAKNKNAKVAMEDVSESRKSASEEKTGTPDPSGQLTLADLQNFSDKICGKLDILTEEVSSLSRKINDLEASVEFNGDRITEIENSELSKLRKSMQTEISKLEEKLITMEIYNRKSNLLFYGIEEAQGEDIFAVLRQTFTSLGISEEEAKDISFNNAHRLPRRHASSSTATPSPAPATIIAKFVSIMDRDHVLSSFEQQQRQRGKDGTSHPDRPRPSHRITVRTDLPPALKARRSVLATTAYHLRKDKGVSTRIIVKGVNVILQWKEKGTTKWKEKGTTKWQEHHN